MTKALIQAIINRITSELPQFKTVRIYNNDLQNMDDGKVDSFQYPAIFISFPEAVIYRDYGSGIQNTEEIAIRFHIADKYFKDSYILDIFDLKEAVFNKIHKFQPAGCSSFVRFSEQTDENRGNVYAFIQDYKTKFINDSKSFEKGLTEINGIGFEPTYEVVINENTKDKINTEKQGGF